MEIPGYDNKAALQQVNQFWSMLDDMSQNNPEEYRTFIERQLREGAEFHSPPQPHACIRTALLGSKEGILYINMCGWKRVPAPTSYSDPVPQEKKPARSGLIEVISSTESDQSQPQQPKHRLTVCPDGSGSSRSLQLSVELSGVRSVSQCRLSISRDDILLEVEDLYYLHLQFPELVKEDTCTATFNKKKQTLNVTVTV
uniref:PIH1 domain-containing protein 2-like n=1 Tax=Sinocyclocheilus rhinocerous TaxID=307959 RepID=A0A673JKT6_9TELE